MFLFGALWCSTLQIKSCRSANYSCPGPWRPEGKRAFLQVTGWVCSSGRICPQHFGSPSQHLNCASILISQEQRESRDSNKTPDRCLFFFCFSFPSIYCNAICWTESSLNMSDGFTESKMLPLLGLVCFLMLLWGFFVDVFFVSKEEDCNFLYTSTLA